MSLCQRPVVPTIWLDHCFGGCPLATRNGRTFTTVEAKDRPTAIAIGPVRYLLVRSYEWPFDSVVSMGIFFIKQL